jgi:hypothetical protein
MQVLGKGGIVEGRDNYTPQILWYETLTGRIGCD